MKTAAKSLEFEKAALLRDQVIEMKGPLALKQAGREKAPIWEQDRVLATIEDDEDMRPEATGHRPEM